MSQVFESGGGARYLELIAKARKTNAKRDEIERRAGFATPTGDLRSSEGISLGLRAAITALVCGIDFREWDAVAEGLAILQDVEVAIRAPAQRKPISPEHGRILRAPEDVHALIDAGLIPDGRGAWTAEEESAEEDSCEK